MNHEDELDQLLRSSERIEIPAGSAFFTARVLDSLPAPLRGTGLTPRTRALLLAGFHGGAAVLAWAILWAFAPESLGALADQAHALFGAPETGGPFAGIGVAEMLGGLAVALVLAVAVMVAPRGRPTHTPTA